MGGRGWLRLGGQTWQTGRASRNKPWQFQEMPARQCASETSNAAAIKTIPSLFCRALGTAMGFQGLNRGRRGPRGTYTVLYCVVLWTLWFSRQKVTGETQIKGNKEGRGWARQPRRQMADNRLSSRRSQFPFALGEGRVKRTGKE